MTDRGVTITLEYVLSLSIAMVVITGLLVAGVNFVDDNRQRVVETELRVVGQQVAADVQRVDRLARAGELGADRVALNSSYPERVAGTGYRISIRPDVLPGDRRQVRLSSFRSDVSVDIETLVASDLEATNVTGGDIAVVYDRASSTVEVRADA